MRRTVFTAVLILFVFSLQSTSVKGQEMGARKSYTCYNLTVQPQLDGKVSGDPAWDNVPGGTGFLVLGGSYTVAKQTVMKFAHDKENLYIAMECDEPDVIRIKPLCKDGDIMICGEDSIEIFLFPAGAKEYFQFMVSTVGARWNGKGVGIDYPPGQWKAFTCKGDNYWSAEVVLPFTVFGVTPKKGDKWTGNFCRNIYVYNSGGDKYTSWTYVGAGFHEPQNFADLIFEDKGIDAKEAGRIAGELNSDYMDCLTGEVQGVAKKGAAYAGDISKALNDDSIKKEAAFLQDEWNTVKKVAEKPSSFSAKEIRSVLAKSKSLIDRSNKLKYNLLYKKLLE